jgi:uncharacterized protein YbjT (DUF2867 family)
MTKPIALVAGATGLVGKECLRLLADDAGVEEVRALVRRPLSAETLALGNICECKVDFDRLEEHADWFAADWVFCALGTRIRQAGSQDAFRRVDFDYPLSVARAGRAAGARHFLLVSAAGADARSRVFYNRVKGELEEAVRRVGYPSLTITRPSLLLGDRPIPRMGEEISKRLAWLFPSKWKPVHASQVALALLRSAQAGEPGVRILENTDIHGRQ